MIGDPIALFVLPTIVPLSAMVPSGTYRGQDHRLRIERLRESSLTAYDAQGFFDETRHIQDRITRAAVMAARQSPSV